MVEYWQFHVRLLDVEADLWRRFLVPKKATFFDLHNCIQDACGWTNSHLFLFQSDDDEVIAGIPDGGWGPPDPDAETVKLSSHFGGRNARDSCVYVYDFGDGWTHMVTLEGVVKSKEQFQRRLLDGAGVFPPEDCGSIPGYERCVAAATGKGWTKEHEEEGNRDELLEWLGSWRPDSFSLQALKRVYDA
jgi:hypothetical protein